MAAGAKMISKSRFHGRIWAKLARDAGALLKPGDRVLAAVSGGPDSVCLAHFIKKLSERRPIRLRLVHFDHGLRAGSKRDARFVQALGDRLGAPVTIERLAVRATARREGRTIEEAGRTLRYRALARLARRTRCNKVATGHQLDDQAEQLLLHLLRGASLKGLAGIPRRRPLAPGVEVVRPLLGLTRREVLDYLAYHRLSYRSDPTNRSTKFLRNWVRSRLLPLFASKNPQVRERLAALAEEVATLAEKS